MTEFTNGPDLSAKHMCNNCVEETYLSKEIKENGKRCKCSYCETVGKTYSIQQMAERISEVFEEHYERTPDQPDYTFHYDSEIGETRDRSGDPVVSAIENAA